MTNPTGSETTGRYLVLLEPDAAAEGARVISQVAGLQLASTADFAAGAAVAEQLGQADGLVLHELGVAVVTAAADQAAGLTRAAADPGPIRIVEPERVVRAIGSAVPMAEPAAIDETKLTWGLQATGADRSTATGAGVRVAVLDTGLDVKHPDLSGRTVVTNSFISGEPVQDGHGHGTHCVGTSCGLRTPASGPGYGVAYKADIYAGKVLSNRGSGADGGILSGIAWAVTNGCRVVSMSLGAPTEPGQPYSQVFEQAAQRAMQRGTLIIAAAGNESERTAGKVAPVGHPANCPSIMAVGAVEAQGQVASFSSGTVDTVGQVDLVAPGVDVYSSWPMPTRYRRLNGTSMATPHVAGLAALIGGLYPQAGPYELWARLVQTARRLSLPSTDVGAGLAQAP
ncbi:MAG TPA: S8 family serine peptidase [Pseudonocardiaceae bacterium]|jgi:subtilisin family serine protease|nr:S8 family serine peptidase [Pseudonocardiaceae bacterium]